MQSLSSKVYFSRHAEINMIRQLITTISIYQPNSKIVPLQDLKTLKLFSEIDQAFLKQDKQLVLDKISEFMLNKDGCFNSNYGKAKDQLESLLLLNIKKNINY